MCQECFISYNIETGRGEVHTAKKLFEAFFARIHGRTER